MTAVRANAAFLKGSRMTSQSSAMTGPTTHGESGTPLTRVCNDWGIIRKPPLPQSPPIPLVMIRNWPDGISIVATNVVSPIPLADTYTICWRAALPNSKTFFAGFERRLRESGVGSGESSWDVTTLSPDGWSRRMHRYYGDSIPTGHSSSRPSSCFAVIYTRPPGAAVPDRCR